MEEDLTAAGGGDDNLYVIKSLHNNKFSYQKEVEFGLELHTIFFVYTKQKCLAVAAKFM